MRYLCHPFPQCHQHSATGCCLSDMKPSGLQQPWGRSTTEPHPIPPGGVFSRDPVSSPPPYKQAALFSAPWRWSLFQLSRVSPAFLFLKKKLYIYIYNIYSTMKISMETNGAAGKYAEQQQQQKKAQNRTDSQLLPELMLSFPTSPPKPRSPRCARGAGGPPRLPPLSPQSSAPSPGSQLCPLIRLHPPRGRAPGRSQ